MSGELLARIDERQRFGGAAEPAPPAPNGSPGADPQPEAATVGRTSRRLAASSTAAGTRLARSSWAPAAVDVS